MKKKRDEGYLVEWVCLKKIFLFMKLMCVFMFFLLFQVSAKTEAQVRVSLEVENASLLDVIQSLRSQTGYKFFFNHNELKKADRISVKFVNEDLKQVLNVILSKVNLSYREEHGVIIITPAEDEKKQVTIKGWVRDEKKHPLPGVTVQVKGISVGTATNLEGYYQITLPNAPKKFSLVYSFVGMVTQEIAYAGKDTINIVMKEDVETLEDVVVTGYSNIRNSSFTGNAVTIKKEDLLKVSKTNVIKALQSFDPSFRIKENNRWGSDPNALPEVYIRGESGIGVKQLDKDALSKSNLVDNPNLPTFIMDGFEVSVSKLYDMDPNRIESITILKDATATALYGSRAANGVVVITTVPPKAGKLNVDYNFVGDVTFPDLTDYNLLNAKEKLEAERLAGCFEADPTD